VENKGKHTCYDSTFPFTLFCSKHNFLPYSSLFLKHCVSFHNSYFKEIHRLIDFLKEICGYLAMSQMLNHEGLSYSTLQRVSTCFRTNSATRFDYSLCSSKALSL
jgi:hypothetical protein